MAEELPEEIKAKILNRMLKEIAKRRYEASSREGIVDPERIVSSKLADDRARELLSKTKIYYPDIYPEVVKILAALIKNNIVKELDGYTLYNILVKLGIYVKPDLKIKFVKHGKEVDFKEYMGD